ncbi:MAG: 50S ribosomal protein L9 [Treponema sp.]|nr:50S ribosomal protein L9 [Treponema sp.]
MKVILNKDLATLGEEGDVKDVARGYARNYLFPRGIALPYTSQTIKLFEARKGEIEARKAEKRQNAMGVKERLENLEISVTMPAGANGKLYGAVTAQTVADELGKLGFDVDRKRIDLSATSIKVVGKYKATVRLYENSKAEIQITVIGQEIKTESPRAPARPARRRRDEVAEEASASSQEAGVSQEADASTEADSASESVASQEPAAAAAPPAEA